MDVINYSKPQNCKLTFQTLRVIISYVDLQDIIMKLMPLSKEFK